MQNLCKLFARTLHVVYIVCAVVSIQRNVIITAILAGLSLCSLSHSRHFVGLLARAFASPEVSYEAITLRPHNYIDYYIAEFIIQSNAFFHLAFDDKSKQSLPLTFSLRTRCYTYLR